MSEYSYHRDIPLPASFPDASFAVINAYKHYWKTTHRSANEMDARSERLSRVNAVIHDFCGDRITAAAYHAAILMPFMDKADDALRSRNAVRALKIFREQSMAGSEVDNYTLGLLTDRPVIASFWESQQLDIARIANEAQLPAVAEALSPEMAEQPVDVTAWLHEPGLAPLEHVEALLDEVNLESLIIQAAELLEWFESDKAGNNGETLSYIYAAESLFAPLAEIIGFDGLAMALQNACTRLRYHNTGQDIYIEQAERILQKNMPGEEVDALVDPMLQEVLGETVYDQVLSHQSNHGIIIGEGVTDDYARVIWRRKSVGSLAKKLQRNGIGQIPADIIGATVVLPTLDMMSKRFATMLSAIHTSPNLSLTPSPSREQAIHVRGSSDYIEALRIACDYTSREDMEQFVDVKDAASGEFHVAKATFTYAAPNGGALRTEIQFNTEQDRIDARIGSAAHIAYKYAKTGQSIDVEILKRIRARKDDMSRQILISPSHERAQHLLQVIDATQYA